MATTKKKIRLLDPYGYRDQDFYIGENGLCHCEGKIEEIEKVNSAQTSAITAIISVISGGTYSGDTLWESGGTSADVRATVKDMTNPGKAPMIEIHKDGTFWLWVEDDMICLNEILKGLTHETY